MTMRSRRSMAAASRSAACSRAGLGLRASGGSRWSLASSRRPRAQRIAARDGGTAKARLSAATASGGAGGLTVQSTVCTVQSANNAGGLVRVEVFFEVGVAPAVGDDGHPGWGVVAACLGHRPYLALAKLGQLLVGAPQVAAAPPHDDASGLEAYKPTDEQGGDDDEAGGQVRQEAAREGQLDRDRVSAVEEPQVERDEHHHDQLEDAHALHRPAPSWPGRRSSERVGDRLSKLLSNTSLPPQPSAHAALMTLQQLYRSAGSARCHGSKPGARWSARLLFCEHVRQPRHQR